MMTATTIASIYSNVLATQFFLFMFPKTSEIPQ